MISKRTISNTAGWMLDLPLTDKQEKLYALIYSKTDAGGRWAMTAKDVAVWCRCSVRHAKRLIRELEDLGLIAHEVVTWKNGKLGGTKTEFWAIDPEDATPAPDGSKTHITWKGNGGTPGDTHVPTPYNDSNINKHTTKNTKEEIHEGREDAPAAAAFVPPTVEEVTAYAEAQGFADPAGFADYYVRYQTEAGWMTGKGSKRHQITNWKLNVVQWSQYRKNQVFSQPDRATAQPRKQASLLTPEEFNSLFD